LPGFVFTPREGKDSGRKKASQNRLFCVVFYHKYHKLVNKSIMKGTLITADDDEIPINIEDLGEEFKQQQKTELGVTPVLSGDRPTEFVCIYDHLGFTKRLKMNTICNVLTQKDIRGHAVIMKESEYKEWLASE
jgi:hypothetical protein